MKTFREITKKDELLTRIKDGKLSVGCHLSQVIHLLSRDKIEGAQEIEVTYTPKYGKITKKMWIK